MEFYKFITNYKSSKMDFKHWHCLITLNVIGSYFQIQQISVECYKNMTQ